MNSVRLEDPYDYINPMYNIHYDNNLFDTNVEYNREDYEEEELFEDTS